MPPAAAKRVLVVDDDDDLRDLLKMVVERAGYSCDTAYDGLQAVEGIEKDPPDLVIMDLMLPRYGGFEILRRLQRGPLSKLPVIVVTGRYNDPAMASMIRSESNVAEFLPKPINTEGLAAALKRLLAPASKG